MNLFDLGFKRLLFAERVIEISNEKKIENLVVPLTLIRTPFLILIANDKCSQVMIRYVKWIWKNNMIIADKKISTDKYLDEA